MLQENRYGSDRYGTGGNALLNLRRRQESVDDCSLAACLRDGTTIT
jgi:hypothetical protein